MSLSTLRPSSTKYSSSISISISRSTIHNHINNITITASNYHHHHHHPCRRHHRQISTMELLQLDRQHVWHPYAVAGPTTAGTVTTTTSSISSTNQNDAFVPIESAHGVYLKVRSGSSYDINNNNNNSSSSSSSSSSNDDASLLGRHDQELVDGMSNWWATIHGYNHPKLNDAIIVQLSQMSHIMFGGLTHEPAIQLCTKLCQLTQLDVCFLSDSGSVAVEVAMKMAIQYWNGRYAISSSSSSSTTNTNTKSKFITVRNGYHGDTFMAMSVCDPINGMHHTQFPHGTILQPQYFVHAPTPYYPNSHLSTNNNNNNNHHHHNNNNNEPPEEEEFDESHMNELIDTLEQYHMNIAAMIIEPIVQGAGGMRMYHPQYLRRVRELCTAYDILLIYDEIATGFGRTNHFFGHDHCYDYDDDDNNNANNQKYKPDIICLGKALTGGYMSLAATITTNHVAEVIHTVTSDDNNNNNNNTNTTINASYRPVLMHGPTFMGNPLACSVALASISLLENSPPLQHPQQELSHSMSTSSYEIPALLPQHTSSCTDWRRSVPMIEQQLRHELMECTESEHVQSVRVLGAIGVVEMKYPIHDMKLLQHTIVKDYGVWLRPFGKLIYTMPPYIISTEQLRKITTAMVQLTRRRF